MDAAAAVVVVAAATATAAAVASVAVRLSEVEEIIAELRFGAAMVVTAHVGVAPATHAAKAAQVASALATALAVETVPELVATAASAS